MKYISLILVSLCFSFKIKAQTIKSQNESATHPPAFKFHLPDTTGRIYSLDDFKGKYIVMHFWDLQCGPCRGLSTAMSPVIDSLAKARPDIVFISVNIDEKRENWIKGVKSKVFDNPGEIKLREPFGFKNGIAEYYRIHGIPFMVIIDKKGEIISFGDAANYLNRKAYIKLDKNNFFALMPKEQDIK